MLETRYTSQDLRKTLLKPFLLYLFAFPFIVSVIVSLLMTNIEAFFYNSIALILYLGVLYLSKRGFLQEYEYNQSRLIQAPKIPYKLLSALLLAVVVFYSAFIIAQKSFINAGFLSLVSFVGYYLYYGFDPRKDKINNIGDISSEFVFDTINEAKQKIAFITNKLSSIQRHSLKQKIENALVLSNEIVQTLQEDPQEIRVARKFLMVYLDGIKDIIISYTEIKSEDISYQTHDRLEELFDDVQKRFDKELEKLKKSNQFDLDVNIQTLHEQLKT